MSNDRTRFGRYELIRLIGRGGMAEVFLAEIVGPGGFRKPVAIKRVLQHYAEDDRFIEMLHDEARIAAAINHRHVAKVFDLGAIDGLHYIAMEFIDGVDLAGVLRTLRARDELIPMAPALYIAKCIAEGLHAAHTLTDEHGKSLRVIHRDVSPHNILISYEGDVKLTDFGVAKARSNLTQTRSGVIKGKILYMSPEQARAKPLDGGADIFALGLTLYRMLTGRLPFSGENEFQIYEQLLYKRPVSPRHFEPSIPARVEAIVMKALRKERSRRFKTALDMAHLLGLAIEDIHPWFSAADLGQFMTESVSRDHIPDPGDDDDDAVALEPDDADDVDEAAIDRLTRLEGGYQPPTQSDRRTAPLPTVELGSSSDTDADVDVSPVPRRGSMGAAPSGLVTESADDLAAIGVEEDEGDADPMLAMDTTGPVEIPSTFERLDAHTSPNLPSLSELRLQSTPSVRTSQIRWLPRRRVGLLVPLFFLAGVGTTVMFAVDSIDAPATPPPAPSAPGIERLMRNAMAPVDVPDKGESLKSLASGAGPEIGSDVPPFGAIAGGMADAAPRELDDRDIGVPEAPSPARRTKKPQRAKPRMPRPRATKSETQPEAAQATEKGYLTVSSLPWAWIEVDGVPLDRHTPVMKYPIEAGKRTVRLRTQDGRTHTEIVIVRSGKPSMMKHTFD